MMEENDIKDDVNGTELINGEFPMIAKTMAELEDVLAEELIGLGANNVEIGTRMVSFTGDKLLYKQICIVAQLRAFLSPFITSKQILQMRFMKR